MSILEVTRKTDKGFLEYEDASAPDTFIFSGAEDLVRFLREEDGKWHLKAAEN